MPPDRVRHNLCMRRACFLLVCLTGFACLGGAQTDSTTGVTMHETTGKKLDHSHNLEQVSQQESPVEHLYIKTGDSLYVATALRKPAGKGPFPAMLVLHGAPAGRGMEQLERWSLGQCGGPVWEGLLKAGFVVAVGDYRGNLPAQDVPGIEAPPAATPANAMAQDALAIVDYLRSRNDVDPERIGVYGVSLGGDVALHLATRTSLRTVVLGAPAARTFLGTQRFSSDTVLNDYSNEPAPPVDGSVARANVARLQADLLLLVGTRDRLLPLTRKLHEQLRGAGKRSELHIYRNGYHDFPMGPQCHDPVRFPQPYIDATAHSFNLTLDWLKQRMLP
jgi:dipeptidyl aminopeptidase/acylaminoacyl peptidase